MSDTAPREDDDCPPPPAMAGALRARNARSSTARACTRAPPRSSCNASSDSTLEIKVTRCGETVGGDSIMGILTLGAGIGSTITVAALGAQAQEALDALEALVANRFGEDE